MERVHEITLVYTYYDAHCVQRVCRGHARIPSHLLVGLRPHGGHAHRADVREPVQIHGFAEQEEGEVIGNRAGVEVGM